MMTQTKYAEHRGVSRQRINQLVKSGVLVLYDGKLAHVECDRILDQTSANPINPPIKHTVTVRNAPTAGGNGGATTLTEARTQSELLNVALKERNIAKIDGETVEIAHVKQILLEVMVIVGSQLDGLGGRVALDLAGMDHPAEIQALLLRECRQIRTAAANHLKLIGV